MKDGLLGLSLFYYHYYLHTDNPKFLELTGKYLNKCFLYLKESQIEYFSTYDLLDLGRFTSYLNKEKVLNTDDTIDFLLDTDVYAIKLLDEQFTIKNLDSVLGVIGIGHYFLDTSQSINRDKTMNYIIDFISDSSIIDTDDSIYWTFPSAQLGQEVRVKRFGPTNGQAGVLNFLLKALQQGYQSKNCTELIEKSIANLLKSKGIYQGFRTFPYALFPEYEEPYQNIAYGDIGVGNFLYRYGVFSKQPKLKTIGLQTIERASEFRDTEYLFIKDAPLLHGASGLAAFFETYAKETNSKKINKAASYWRNQVLNFSTLTNHWAGFKTYYNGYDNRFQLSYAYGISGIGLFLMHSKQDIKHAYLSFLNFHIE
ncbi:lanthionine synthetase LanC family protein [Myroides odoratus]|nr:lanthionine synthetase LanC family protein [Myroides odoratus]WQD58985.1 lanthionine synthetase LanC family protein [Myroides odoratus]